MPYKPFRRKDFHEFLGALAGQGEIRCWNEVSAPPEIQGAPAWEHVYELQLGNCEARLLIFSSVCRRTGKSREINGDAVRVVYCRQTPAGQRYSRVCKKYRVEKLFDNLAKVLTGAAAHCFNLERYFWEESLALALGD